MGFENNNLSCNRKYLTTGNLDSRYFILSGDLLTVDINVSEISGIEISGIEIEDTDSIFKTWGASYSANFDQIKNYYLLSGSSLEPQLLGYSDDIITLSNSQSSIPFVKKTINVDYIKNLYSKDTLSKIPDGNIQIIAHNSTINDNTTKNLLSCTFLSSSPSANNLSWYNTINGLQHTGTTGSVNLNLTQYNSIPFITYAWPTSANGSVPVGKLENLIFGSHFQILDFNFDKKYYNPLSELKFLKIQNFNKKTFDSDGLSSLISISFQSIVTSSINLTGSNSIENIYVEGKPTYYGNIGASNFRCINFPDSVKTLHLKHCNDLAYGPNLESICGNSNTVLSATRNIKSLTAENTNIDINNFFLSSSNNVSSITYINNLANSLRSYTGTDLILTKDKYPNLKNFYGIDIAHNTFSLPNTLENLELSYFTLDAPLETHVLTGLKYLKLSLGSLITNIENLNKLEFLYLHYVPYSGTTLDTINCSSLSSIELRNMEISSLSNFPSNSVTDLKIEGNPNNYKFTSFSAINWTTIKNIDLSYQNFENSTVVVSACPELKDLTISYSKLKNISISQATTNKLSSINFQNNILTSFGTDYSGNSAIRYLNLSNNTLLQDLILWNNLNLNTVICNGCSSLSIISFNDFSPLGSPQPVGTGNESSLAGLQLQNCNLNANTLNDIMVNLKSRVSSATGYLDFNGNPGLNETVLTSFLGNIKIFNHWIALSKNYSVSGFNSSTLQRSHIANINTNNINTTTAVISADLITLGGGTFLEKGIQYRFNNTLGSYTTITSPGGSLGTFSVTITGLNIPLSTSPFTVTKDIIYFSFFAFTVSGDTIDYNTPIYSLIIPK